MSDRLHEIIGEIGVLHNKLIENQKITSAVWSFRIYKRLWEHV